MKGKRRTTFQKLDRERAVRERRARKVLRKEQRLLDAAAPVLEDSADGDSKPEPE
jgi:hypothetical protein